MPGSITLRWLPIAMVPLLTARNATLGVCLNVCAECDSCTWGTIVLRGAIVHGTEGDNCAEGNNSTQY